MKDFIGNELNIGDKVAVSRKPYHDMKVRYVIGFTEKGYIRVSREKDGKPDIGTMPYENRYVAKLFNQ